MGRAVGVRRVGERGVRRGAYVRVEDVIESTRARRRTR